MGDNIPWTDDQIERLKALHAEKLSSRVIGERLGVTRNAIIGKLGRLGLSVPRPVTARRKARVLRKRQQGLDTGIANHMKRQPAIPFVDLAPDQSDYSVGFFEARAGDCRFPLTEVSPIHDFRFCGAPTLAGYSWCKRHSAIVFNLPRKAAA